MRFCFCFVLFCLFVFVFVFFVVLFFTNIHLLRYMVIKHSITKSARNGSSAYFCINLKTSIANLRFILYKNAMIFALQNNNNTLKN